MLRKYISDYISLKDIENWLQGKMYLIKAGTGCGKTYFLREKLYRYCTLHNKSMAIITNRIALRRQIRNDMQNSNIYLISYQQLEKLCEEEKAGNGFNLERYAYDKHNLNDFDFICFDECHYFFSDIAFNRYSDYMLKKAKTLKNPVMLFLSATPVILERFLGSNLKLVCDVKTDYNYIEKIYYYNDRNTANTILLNIPLDEKVLFFASNKERLKNLSSQNRNSVYFSTESIGKDYYNNLEVDTDDRDEIEENELSDEERTHRLYEKIIRYSKFDNHSVFTTKVLDNGVNIIDRDVKHIFIEMSDLIDFIQCLGRKRVIDNKDKITLYIYNFKKNIMAQELSRINQELEDAEEARNDRSLYLSRHRRDDLPDIMDNIGYTILVVKERYLYIREIYSKIINDENTYLGILADLLDKDLNTFEMYENVLNRESLMERVIGQYLGVRMYEHEKEMFKNMFVQNLINPVHNSRRSLGINTINGVLRDFSIPFIIKSVKCSSRTDEHYGKRYWILEEHIWEEDILE